MPKSTWVPPGHFYSPLVDPTDPHVRNILAHPEDLYLDGEMGIQIDDEAMLQLLHSISAYYKDLPFPKQKSSPWRYYYENPAFCYGDASVYFGMLRHFRPKRVIEIGSGYSSCLAMDTNDQFLDKTSQLSFIEPYPQLLFDLIGEDAEYRQNVVVSKVQDVPTHVFRELQAGDFLFIDSSHVAKMGSDVNDYLFRILPCLNEGVIIQIHDIQYPFEYGSEWIDHENRSWNEAYALRAFLQFNESFRILFFNHYMFLKHGDLLQKLMPNCVLNSGASLWIEKTRNPYAANPLYIRSAQLIYELRAIFRKVRRRLQRLVGIQTEING